MTRDDGGQSHRVPSLEAEVLQLKRTLAMLVAAAGGRVEVGPRIHEGEGWHGKTLVMTPDMETGSYVVELTSRQ